MRIGILAFSQKGMALAQRLADSFNKKTDFVFASRCENGGLNAWTRQHFYFDDALVFIGCCGIAVRAIAPYVKSKLTDPAVIVVDETGTFAVSLLSGHIGGANQFAQKIAAVIGAVPVITTATDQNGLFAVDTWARDNGLFIANPHRVKDISSRLLEGKTIKLKSDYPVKGMLPKGVALCGQDYDVAITHREDCDANALCLIAPVLSLGVGCKKNTAREDIESAFCTVMKAAGLHEAAIEGVYSIDLKENEQGLVDFCRSHSLPLTVYSAERLNSANGDFSSSDFVRSVTGTDNVCERSALLGAGRNGELIVKKFSQNGVTMAIAKRHYIVGFED